MSADSHNLILVFASIAVSLVSAFTGLALTNNIAVLSETKRKSLVAMSALTIGGGIWSMHFVAMLAHEFTVPVYYDSLQTLGSVLIAILVVGVALLVLHFSTRTPARLVVCGLILGAGIIVMHYVGMLAIRGVIPNFSTASILLAVLVAAIAGVLAVRVAYGNRSKQNIVFGSVVFGLSVAAVHYTAMFGTTFQEDASLNPAQVALDHHSVAMTVTVAIFAICGAFLLVTTTFLTQLAPQSVRQPAGADGKSDTDNTTGGAGSLETTQVTDDEPDGKKPDAEHPRVENLSPKKVAAASVVPATKPAHEVASLQVPFEKNKKMGYLKEAEIGAIRADGHYTQLYTRSGVFFCPWSITEAEKKLAPHDFHRTHRSYLVNIDAVDAFEKRKESGVCLFADFPQLSSVPVSRNRMIALSQVLDAKTKHSISH